MNYPAPILEKPSRRLSDEGKIRLLSHRGEPLFHAAWEQVLFMHFRVAPEQLQPSVPFELQLHEGSAYVSLVAFTMRGMHFRRGGKRLAWLTRPVAAHHFLNVRTYVQHEGEPGIYFIAEWLSNWLSAQLGPLLYGLPYRFAEINYCHLHHENHFAGEVRAGEHFCYTASFLEKEIFSPCAEGSLDEFLLERYTAFTANGAKRRLFRIWHSPWPQQRMQLNIGDDLLMKKNFLWFRAAEFVSANFSPGFQEVWMGRPHRVR